MLTQLHRTLRESLIYKYLRTGYLNFVMSRSARTRGWIHLGLLPLLLSACGGGTIINSTLNSTPDPKYAVDVTWNAPEVSPVPVAAYNLYRSPVDAFEFQQLNTTPITQTNYLDTDVVSGQTYDYFAVSLDATGTMSDLSDRATVVVP